MDRTTCTNLVRALEADPSRVPAFYTDLEAAFRWLRETTDQDE